MHRAVNRSGSIVHGYPADSPPALASPHPMGRFVTANEVAEAIVYLASPRSGSTTGTNLVVDGGLVSLRLPS